MLFVYSDKTNIGENKYLVLMRVHVFSIVNTKGFSGKDDIILNSCLAFYF